MSREAMRLALDYIIYMEGGDGYSWRIANDKKHGALAALRAALAADELTKESERLGLYSEPVAWEFTLDGCRQVMLDEDADEAIRHHGIPLYRHPPAAFTLVDGVDPARIKDFDVTAYGRDGDGFDRTP